jgi:peroxiredoxin
MNSTDSESIAAISLSDPDGNPATLGEYRADRLVVVLVRYFGCLPCQEYLIDLTREQRRLAEGSRVIAVGASAPHQARWLRRTKGVEIPLLFDVEERVRGIAEIGNLSVRQVGRMAGIRNYLRAMRRGIPPQVPTGDILKAPGIIVFDADFNPLWVHRGETLGDYPPIADLFDRVVAIADRS